ATVLGTAEQHGGTVRVTTQRAKGSAFTIVLLAARGESVALLRSLQPPSRGAVRAMNILIIDDEAMVAEAARRMLASRGHRVHVATSPDEALVVWDVLKDDLDVVVCDVVMLDTHGPDLIQ